MTARTSPNTQAVADDRPAAEMAAWDPMDEQNDAGRELSELDRRSMSLLGQVGAITLVLALATGLMTRFS